jgi:hypothetical protein
MTMRLAAATAERVEAAAFVAGECAVHGTAAETAALAEAVILLARAEKLLRGVAEGKAVKAAVMLKLATHGYGKAA